MKLSDSKIPFCRYHHWLAVFFMVPIALGLYLRIYFGVDVTDEAQYLSQVYILTRGSDLFEHDLFFQQVASALFIPFIYPFVKLQGNSDSIFLYARHLFFCLNIGVGMACYFSLKNFLPRTQSLLISMLSISFVPFSIPSISYNTVSLSMFLLTCFFILQFHQTKRPIWVVASAWTTLTSLVAYPPLAVSYVFMFGAYAYHLWKTHEGTNVKLFVKIYFLSAALFAIGYAALLLSGGLERLLDSLKFSRLMASSGTFQKFQFMWVQCQTLFSIKNSIPFLFCLPVSLFFRFFKSEKWNDRFLQYFLYLCFLLFFFIHFSWTFQSKWLQHHFIILLSLFSFIYCLFLLPQDQSSKPLHLIIITSMVAGLVYAITSSNGLLSAAMGLYPGLIVASCLLPYQVLNDATISPKPKAILLNLTLCFTILIFGFFIFHYYQLVHGDERIEQLQNRVSEGPYKGLWTTEFRAQYLSQFQATLSALIASHSVDSVLFLEDLPSGYLMSNLKPKTRMLAWHSHPFSGKLNELMVTFFRRKENYPDVVVFLAVGGMVKTYPLKNAIIHAQVYVLYQKIPGLGRSEVYFMVKKEGNKS